MTSQDDKDRDKAGVDEAFDAWLQAEQRSNPAYTAYERAYARRGWQAAEQHWREVERKRIRTGIKQIFDKEQAR